MRNLNVARTLLFAGAVGAFALVSAVGCVSLKAPEQVYIDGGGHQRVSDPSSVPPTRSHEEARQKLAEAYGEIRYLRHKVEKLEEDKRELKDERDEYKHRCDD